MINESGKDDPTQSTKPPGAKPKRAWELTALAAVVVVLGLAFKFMAAGWGILLFGIPYLAIGVIHFLLHRSASARIPNAKPAPIALLVASHAFFVLGFLLQIDGGDGPSWMTINYLIGGGFRAGYPSWWPGL